MLVESEAEVHQILGPQDHQNFWRQSEPQGEFVKSALPGCRHGDYFHRRSQRLGDHFQYLWNLGLEAEFWGFVCCWGCGY